MKNPKIVTIVGRSNSGKTTLIENLIRYFHKKGNRVSAIKSIRHDFNIDYPGKDSYRYKEAGVFSSAITNGRSFAIVSDIDDNMKPVDMAHRYFNKSEIVIIEGFKEGDTEKIEVIGSSPELPLFMSDIKNIKAIVADKNIDTELPVFKRTDIDKIGLFILKNF